MRAATIRRFAAAVFAIGLVIAFAELHGRTASVVEVRGHVVDLIDRPASGVVVSNDWNSTTATTDARGNFSLRIPHLGADDFIVLTVRHDGIEARHRYIGAAGQHPILIRLER